MSIPAAGILLSVALWAVAWSATIRLGRAAIARFPFDWRSYPEYREQNEAVLSARLTDSFRDWGKRQWVWAAALLAGSFALAVMEFTLAFTVGIAAFLSAWLEAGEAQRRWEHRLSAVGQLGPPTRRSKVWHTTFTLLGFLTTFAYIAFFACAGHALADAFNV